MCCISQRKCKYFSLEMYKASQGIAQKTRTIIIAKGCPTMYCLQGLNTNAYIFYFFSTKKISILLVRNYSIVFVGLSTKILTSVIFFDPPPVGPSESESSYCNIPAP